MPGIGIGRGLGMVGGHGGGGNPGDGLNALLRDLFTTAVDPVVDGATEPGAGSTAGKRAVTGTKWKIINGRLRGGLPAVTGWTDPLAFTDAADAGLTREDGLALWGVFIAANRDALTAFGWAESAAVGDPTADGHHWLMDQGIARVSTPDVKVSLAGFDAAKVGQIRAIEYLVCVVLRAQGAFYLMSAVTATGTSGVSALTNDAIGIPAFPSARVLWVDDAATVTPLFPSISCRDPIGHVDGNMLDDLRVKVITDWASDVGMATGLDRMTRADSTTSMGAGWTNLRSTWGVSGNKGYQAAYGAPHGLATKNFGLSGDGIWHCRLTAPTTITDAFGVAFRITDGSNFVKVHNGGTAGSLFLTKHVAGVESGFNSTGFSWTAGQTYDITIITVGNQYQLYIDGVLKFDWSTASGNLTGTGMGPYAYTTCAGARWDDFMCVPNTLTLPADIQVGTVPTAFTPGATIMDDTFTAANGTAINGRTPDTTGAGTWTTVGTGWTIEGNAAQNSNVGGGTSYFAHYNCGATDVEITIPFTISGGASITAGAVFRFTNATSFIGVRLLGANGTSQEIEILETIAGVETIVKHQGTGSYLSNGTHTFVAQLVGDKLRVFLNGIQIVDYIVHIASGNNHGMYHNSITLSVPHFDRFTVKALA